MSFLLCAGRRYNDGCALLPGLVHESGKCLYCREAAGYNFSMKSANSAPILDRLRHSLSKTLTPGGARKLLALKADATLQARIDDLADRHSQGLLAPAEQVEYGTYVSYGTF